MVVSLELSGGIGGKARTRPTSVQYTVTARAVNGKLYTTYDGGASSKPELFLKPVIRGSNWSGVFDLAFNREEVGDHRFA